MLKHVKASRVSARDTRADQESADIVIVGNGIAGLTAAVEARSLAPEKRIAIITEQSHPTINTPALKQFAIGKLTQEQLLAYPAGTERARQIEVINARVEEISSKGQYVSLEDGQHFGYGSLLLATGSKPNGLAADVPGRNFDGVLTLHRLSDYLDLHRRLRLREVQDAVVVGGGTHAMETAMWLLESGIRVHWLIRSATFLPHVLDHTASQMVLEYSRRAGIQVFTETEVAGIIGKVGTVVGVVTNHQQTLPCQLMLVCTGTSAVTTLVERCDMPLKHQRGILVDEHLRTNVRDIFAAGDAAALWNPSTGTYQPQAYWHAAVLQGRAAASAMTGCTEAATPFGVPWHATQLGELSLLTVGSPLNILPDAAIVTDRRRESYRCLSIRNGRLVGYLSLGKTQPDSLAIKRLIDEGISIRDVEKDLLAGDLNARQYFAQRHFHAANALVVTGELAVLDTSHAPFPASLRTDIRRNTDPFLLAPTFSELDEPLDEEDPLQKRIERQASLIRSLTPLTNKHSETTRWIVPSVLPQGLVFLAGKQKIGKSWLSLAIGLGVASGETVLGRTNVEQGQVLYLALEESKRHLQERLSQLLVMGASLHDDFAYMTHWSRFQGDNLAEIEAWLVSHPHARLVIIDSWVQSPLDNELQAQMLRSADAEMFENLRELACTHHISILVHYHADDARVNHSFDTLTARSGNNAFADGILHLKGSRGNKSAVLSCTGQAFAQRIDLALSFSNGYWKMAEQKAVRTRDTLTQARGAIIDVLHEHDQPMKPGQIALALGKSPGTIRTMLYEMKLSNLIQATDQGYVALIPQEKRSPQLKSGNVAGKKRIKRDSGGSDEHGYTRNITQFQRPLPKVHRGVRASTNLVEHTEGMLATAITNIPSLIPE